MEIQMPSRTLRRSLIAVAVALSLAGLVAELLRDRPQFDEDASMLLGLLSLSFEGNLPTWFSSSLIMLCAGMLALISYSDDVHGVKFQRHWRALALIFVYLSLDEAVQLHEGLNFVFETRGVLYFGWIIPFGFLVVVLAFVYRNFLVQLPQRARRRFMLAGALYVGGALGMELPLGYWADVHTDEDLTYAMLDWVEESLEICGMLIFALSLADILAGRSGSVRLRGSESV